MRGPISTLATGRIVATNVSCCGTCVCRLQGINTRWLDLQGKWFVGWVHGADKHAGHLTRDNIVGHTKADSLIGVIWHKAQKIVVDAEKIFAMLPRVFEATGCDLRELAATYPTGRDERVDRRNDALSVAPCCIVPLIGLAVIVQLLLVAVPLIRLNGKAVGRVGCTLVVTVNLQMVSLWRNMAST